MRSEGITGTGNRHYSDDPGLLSGVLASKYEPKVYPEGSDDTGTPAMAAERCQHGEIVAWYTTRGRQLNHNFKCKECAWLYAWKEAK